MLLHRVSDYIATHGLMDKGRSHLVALSGGADSVCLLLMLRGLGYDVHAVHCNFHLRGEESNRDEAFCVELCHRLGVELHRTHFDTVAYADLHKVSIEMAARELRYGYFEQLRQAIDAEEVAVAHHRDDNVETFLINLIRGTGIHGLQGIKPRNGHIVRPLLCLCRSEIEDYLTLCGQDYVTDSTNLVDDVVRNKVRLNLLPVLESISPAVRANISKTIAHVSEAVKMVDAALEKGMKEVAGDAVEMPCTHREKPCTHRDMLYIRRDMLQAQPSPEYVLYAILSRYGFSSAQVEQIYASIDAQPGRLWGSESHEAATDRDGLVVAPREVAEPPVRMPETGVYVYGSGGRMSVKVDTCGEGFVPAKERCCVTLDADKVAFPLTLRRTGVGDRFAPFGMRGTKLVSDYLTDRKRNILQRRRQLVVEDATGKIVWLVGERASQQAACDRDTIKVLTLRYSINEE